MTAGSPSCVYDLTKFPGQVIVDVLRGHPAVIVAGALHENPFYTPPETLIEELRNYTNPRSRSSRLMNV